MSLVKVSLTRLNGAADACALIGGSVTDINAASVEPSVLLSNRLSVTQTALRIVGVIAPSG
jgi:hypothetical protein